LARLELAPELFDDSDRFLAHMAQFEIDDLPARIGAILEALQILAGNPLIGWRVSGGKRELVIGQGAHGGVALYRHVPPIDTVFVLAVRNQREQGFRRRRSP
jgi:plasmid stabilization system protein ParE